MKRGDLGQEQKPVHEKAGGWQNGPGGSSSNVPEVAKFNHNLKMVICMDFDIMMQVPQVTEFSRNLKET